MTWWTIRSAIPFRCIPLPTISLVLIFFPLRSDISFMILMRFVGFVAHMQNVSDAVAVLRATPVCVDVSDVDSASDICTHLWLGLIEIVVPVF